MNYYRDALDQPDCQDVINKSYELMVSVIDLGKVDDNHILADDISNDLGHLVRYLRHTWSSQAEAASDRHRTHYIQLLQLICSAVDRKSIRKYDPIEFTSTSFHSQSDSLLSSASEKSVWEHELEVAGYDYPLQQMHGDLYKAIHNIIKVSFDLSN